MFLNISGVRHSLRVLSEHLLFCCFDVVPGRSKSEQIAQSARWTKPCLRFGPEMQTP